MSICLLTDRVISAVDTHPQVAIITGGASGIGLAVAHALAARGEWQLHVFDRDDNRGAAAIKDIPSATFHQADIADCASLAQAFVEALDASNHRLDFVFGNAGIAMVAPFPAAAAEQDNSDGSSPPPAPDRSLVDVNLHGAINTTHLALHYFAQSGRDSGNLILTASSAGFYASAVSPAYEASKHGVVGWTRSVAPAAMREHGIRVNAICPGIVRTNILSDAVFEIVPESMLTPMSKVVEVVMMIVDGDGGISGHEGTGQTVEICGSNHYFREQIEFCDATMRAVMGAGSSE